MICKCSAVTQRCNWSLRCCATRRAFVSQKNEIQIMGRISRLEVIRVKADKDLSFLGYYVMMAGK